MTKINIDILGYLCHLKYIVKMEKNICTKKNQIAKFNKFNIVFENIEQLQH